MFSDETCGTVKVIFGYAVNVKHISSSAVNHFGNEFDIPAYSAIR